jgi:hypothetical protein
VNKNKTPKDTDLDLTTAPRSFFSQPTAVVGLKRRETWTATQVQHDDVDLNDLSKNPREGLQRRKRLFEDELVKLVPALKIMKSEGEARSAQMTIG